MVSLGVVFIFTRSFNTYSQETATPFQMDTATVEGMSDLEVELKAIESVSPMPAESLPDAGTFWSAQHAPGTAEEWPPLPTSFGMGAWSLGDDGVYLLADLNHVYGHPIKSKKATTVLTTASGLTLRTSDVDMNPGDGGDDTNSDSGNVTPLYTPAITYGTNLWLAITSVSNQTANFIVSNTVADVQYEIQSRADLVQSNWNSMGFFYGSETTNWNATSAIATNYPTLFYRIRSWQSSDGSGIPDWWEIEYFGTNGVDPYSDPTGDGWTVLQDFQNGWNPNVFTTPPAPQGVTVTYNSTNGTVTVSWLPSPGSVTGYTVNMNGMDYNVSSSTFSYANSLSADNPYVDPVNEGPIPLADFQVQAIYAGGNSTWSGAVPFEANPTSVPAYLIPGPQGSVYLSVACLPPNTATLRLLRIDVIAHEEFNDSSFDTSLDVPVSEITNGLYELPASWNATPVIDGYGDSFYIWWMATIDTNGATNGSAIISDNNGEYYGYGNYNDAGNNDNNDYASGQTSSWTEPPYFDGREQMKQNLTFLLRAGLNSLPFQFNELASNGSQQGYLFNFPTNYAYAGYYEFTYASGYVPWAQVGVFLPFGENYLYKNFAFDLSDMSSFGLLNSFTNNFNHNGDGPEGLNAAPTYQFQAPTNNGVVISPVLSTNETRWLLSFLPYLYNSYTQIGIIQSGSTNGLASGVGNTFGLPFLSTEVAWGNTSPQTTTLYPGDSTTQDGYFYSETVQPQLQTVEYDFWNPITDTLPGMPGFSTTNAGHLMIASVGNPFTPAGNNFQIAGYAKMAVTNAYSGVYGYLGQYFDTAYQMTNGVATTNTTGVVSPYGNFFATQPGTAALVTMPDPDTGARGTCTVYCVSLNVDANHDGTMDTSFGGADATSPSQPFVFWANNNYDRWKYDLLGSTNEQDDTEIATMPDCQYTTSGYPAIPCPRDLEDYFRLWTPGVAALMKVLPSNYTVQLTLSGAGQIRIFQAVEPNGGTNYLFDETTASNQVANSTSLYFGLLTSSSPIVFNISTNFNEHFIFCGAQTGGAQIDLQVLDANQNVVADAPAYLQINDIKQMYERWTVGDLPNNAPMTTAYLATENLPIGASAFQYTPPQDTNTPYILFVHGWNMEPWEKDRFAETAFKRLYWQGYHGRFGEFRWPTYYDFPLGSWSWQSFNPQNFDNSELNAWQSGAGLLNKLNDLNAQYPNNVYLLAHSLGNVVAGEALRQATSQIVNTYAALQGAVSAHAYDPTTAIRDSSAATPDRYANYYTSGAPCYFNSSAGAGIYVNFFNTNDWALNNSATWPFDQHEKPDTDYGYDGTNFSSGIFPSTLLYFPADTYTIFSHCDEARSYALGAQINVSGAFKSGIITNQIELDIAPYNFSGNPVDHSGEFRSDNARRGSFWNTVLVKMKLK